jgi:hypothetical protein
MTETESPGSGTAEAVEDKLVEQMLSITADSINRTRSGAQFVQTAASAVGVLYTGILALMFSVASHPLPARGMLPTLFFAAAVVLATIYLSFLSDAGDVLPPKIEGDRLVQKLLLANFLTTWVRKTTRNRAPALRAAVASLAVGVALLPIGLLSIPGDGPPAPTAIDWPAPPAIADPDLAALLYERQLDQFVERLDAAGAVAPLQVTLGGLTVAVQDLVALALALAGAAVIAVVAVPADRWRGRRRASARQQGTPGSVPPVAPR